MDSLFADLRFALRSIIRRPGFALAAVVSLGLGLAATTAVFSVVNATLFKPVAGVTRPDGLVEVARDVNGERSDVTWQVFEGLREQHHLVSDLAAFALTQVAILGDGEPMMRGALAVTGNYFELLGVRTQLGRTFLPDEATFPRIAPVAVITQEAWQRDLGGDPQVVGRTVSINGVRVEVIGVLANGFTGHHTALLQDVYLPLGLAMPGLPNPETFRVRNQSSVELLGRIADGVSPGAAARELSVVADRVDRETVGQSERPAYQVAVDRWGPLPSTVRGFVAIFLSILLGLVGAALAMACVNVTTVVLARALDRQRELAVRRALGATRGRVVRQMITEVSMLFAVAGVAGLVLASWATGLLNGFVPPVPIPGRLALDLALDIRVYLFSLLTTFGAALAFSVVPALTASRFDIVGALREGSSSDTRARSRLRGILVGSQLALTTLLLVGTALFTRALESIERAQPEWNLDGVMVTGIELELNGTSREAGIAFYEDARLRIAAIPGVQTVSFASKLPIGGRTSFGLVWEAGVDPTPGTGLDASVNRVTPGYFESMGIPMRRGRDFASTDGPQAPDVAIVNEDMARRLWPDRDAVGQRFYFRTQEGRQEFEVVGVVGNSRFVLPGRPPEVQYYMPMAQWYNTTAVLHVRAAPGFGNSVAVPARDAIREAMPTLPVGELTPITRALAVQLLPQRVAAWVAGSMSLFGLILAAIGIYGVTAYVISRRSREIAIRRALGAGTRQVAGLVLRQGLRAPLIGIGVGLAAGTALAVAVGRVGVIPGVELGDPVVLAIAPVVLTIVALASMSNPIRRALGRPMMSALRED